MPRDGSNIYSQPFPDVEEATTIESAVYNGFTNDVAQDLNAPRPIIAGGTGANNAADAMSNLGGEGSKILVTNYDSHNFTAGSFYSASSATGSPVAGHAFAGWCYPAVVAGVATTDLFIEARDRDESGQPGGIYARQKKGGTWSGWLKSTGAFSGTSEPSPAADNSLWWDPTQGKLFIRYNDGNTTQWVEAVAVPDLGPDDFVSVDVAQSFTETEKVTARSNIYAAPFDALGWSGMQVNGSMEVSQERGTTATSASNTFICDNWKLVFSGSTLAMSGAVSSPNALVHGFNSLLYTTVGVAQASMAAGDYAMLWHFIEGYRVSRLAWGTASAQPLTIAFWSGHARTGVYSVTVRNSAASRSYAATYTQNSSGIPQYNIITVPGCPDGVWTADNSVGIAVVFAMAMGSTSTAPSANTWLTGNYSAAPGQVNAVAVSDIFRLTGVVVLPGIEAPSAARSLLIMRPFDQELVTCRRYWCQGIGGYQGNITNGAFYSGTVNLGVVMRAATPTLSRSSDQALTGFSTPFGEVSSALGFRITAQATTTGFGNFQSVFNADARL